MAQYALNWTPPLRVSPLGFALRECPGVPHAKVLCRVRVLASVPSVFRVNLGITASEESQMKTSRLLSLPAQPIQQLLSASLTLFVLSSVTTAQQQNSSIPPIKAPTPHELATRALQLFEAGKFSAALKAFREAADDGNVEAMMYLGVMYGSGTGTEVDRKST